MDATNTITNIGNNTDESSPELIFGKTNPPPIINWSQQHEKILIEWADKATCYKWLHEKTHREFARKNRWFTIPVIIMSTVTGTANFAQERIPPEYVNVFTMGIGTISLVAGIITTIQQFLKISEMCESHRVSSISWGKFNRNLKIELAKSPLERTPVTQLLKTGKEEFDRLIETSHDVPNHIIKLFKETFSGGEIAYDKNGNILPLTKKQKIYDDLIKPEICDSLESITNNIYRAPKTHVTQKIHSEINETAMNNMLIRNEKKAKLELFIHSFEKEKKRLPTSDEIKDNIEDTYSIDSELIQSVITDIECKSIQSEIGSSTV